MPTYLIGNAECEFKEGEFHLVDAPTREEAITLFVREAGIRDEDWKEEMYGQGFAGRFWSSEDAKAGYDYDALACRYVATPEQFEENVRRYFGPHRDFAQLYLDWWNDDTSEAGPAEANPFPVEMQVYMWLNSNWCALAVFELGDVKRL